MRARDHQLWLVVAAPRSSVESPLLQRSANFSPEARRRKRESSTAEVSSSVRLNVERAASPWPASESFGSGTASRLVGYAVIGAASTSVASYVLRVKSGPRRKRSPPRRSGPTRRHHDGVHQVLRLAVAAPLANHVVQSSGESLAGSLGSDRYGDSRPTSSSLTSITWRVVTRRHSPNDAPTLISGPSKGSESFMPRQRPDAKRCEEWKGSRHFPGASRVIRSHLPIFCRCKQERKSPSFEPSTDAASKTRFRCATGASPSIRRLMIFSIIHPRASASLGARPLINSSCY